MLRKPRRGTSDPGYGPAEGGGMSMPAALA